MGNRKRLPLVSVVMITYNHQDYIKNSLMSVINQQSNEYNLEILIVDDGSSDDTQKIILSVQQDHPDLVFPTFKEHVGVTAINKNLNDQIKKAKGRYITFLSGDDYYIGNGIKKQLNAFNENVVVVIADGINFRIKDGQFLNKCQGKIPVDLMKKNDIAGLYRYLTSNVPHLFIQGLMIEKIILDKIGSFDESVIADDWVLNIKIFKYLLDNNLSVYFLKDDVFRRNILETSTSHDLNVNYERVLQVIKKYVPQSNKKNMLRELYFSYSIAYLFEGNIIKSMEFFMRYYLNDFFMSLIFKKITKRILK